MVVVFFSFTFPSFEYIASEIKERKQIGYDYCTSITNPSTAPHPRSLWGPISLRKRIVLPITAEEENDLLFAPVLIHT
jgi:hypothetical protein